MVLGCCCLCFVLCFIDRLEGFGFLDWTDYWVLNLLDRW